jgi:hypothetical protein
MIKDISNRLLRDFATCLQQRLAAEPAGGMTAGEAAASAGAADAIGKTPAEVSGQASEPSPAAPPPPAPTPSGPAQPPAAAPPVKGFSLLFSVLLERIKGLLRRR